MASSTPVSSAKSLENKACAQLPVVQTSQTELTKQSAHPQVISVKGKEETQAIPEPNATVRSLSPLPASAASTSSQLVATQVIGTVTRITRQAATLSLLTVDGRPCRPDFTGIIRAQDVRQTAKDSVKVRTVARGATVRGEETDEDSLCFLCRFGRVTGQATSSEPRS